MKRILGEARSVRQLLSGAKYGIDYYQRDYRWEQKQAVELVEDLTERFQEDHEPGDPQSAVEGYGHYFLGSMVVSQKDVVRYVVDGQQRLTTLTLLLIHLYHLQQARQSPDDEVPIKELIYSVKYGKKSFNIDVDERAYVMEALLKGEDYDTDGKPESAANILARYRDVQDAFPDELAGASLPHFVNWLVENVHLVEITAFSGDDAYTIFETMNDRGLSLTPTDMLKGYLLANIVDAAQRTKANDLWKGRVQELAAVGKEVDADFFKSWLRSQRAETIRDRQKGAEPGDYDQVGGEFHRWVRDTKDRLGPTTSDGFLRFITREFDFYARHYLRLMRASQQLTPGLEHVFYNAQQGFTLQPMLLLAPLTPDDAEADVDRKWRVAARYLDVLLMRRHWSYKSTAQRAMKVPVFQTTLAVRGLDAPALAARLREGLGAQELAFASNPLFALHGTNRKVVGLILARLTGHVERGSGMASRYLEYTSTRGGKRAYEIEHVWANKPERHRAEFRSDADFRAYRNHVGGLLLLPKSFNASYGALPYDEKVGHYNGAQNLLARSLHSQCYDHNPGLTQLVAKSGLPFAPCATFDRAELDGRTALYQQIAERVWDADALLAEAAGP